MRIHLVFFLFSIVQIGIAQDAVFDWVASMGSDPSDGASTVEVDPSGDVYSCGSFYSTVDFDPGLGTFDLISNGGTDCYIQKLDADRNFLWASSFGGGLHDYARDITFDNLGNVYLIGLFHETVDFDSGPGIFEITAAGITGDSFILKLDPDGNFDWVKTFPNTDQLSIYSAKFDSFGNLYCTGSFSGTVDLDPGAGISTATSEGETDAFVVKLDGGGNFIWAKWFGGSNYDASLGMSFDGVQNIVLSGYFRNTVDFDPGLGVFPLTSVLETIDVFVLKFDDTGDFIWAKTFGSDGNDLLEEITIDASDNIYLTGSFENTVDFDPGLGVYSLTSNGNKDIYVLKLNSAGNFIWAKQIGGTSHDYGVSIVLDEFEDIYIAGGYNDTVDFDPGVGTFNLIGLGNGDSYIEKLSSDGNFIWAKRIGGVGYAAGTYCRSLAVDNLENIYLTGKYRGIVDFDPGVPLFNVEAIGSWDDAFVLKLVYCEETFGTDTITACDSYTWIDGETYTDDNFTATDTLTNAAGCDSVVTLNLTINNSTGSLDIITACDNYIWMDGIEYLEDNFDATYALVNSQGCDSIITLNLTIDTSNSIIDSIAACESYLWIDGIEYFDDNFDATRTLTNMAGCDSVITLNLTIHNSNSSIDSISACQSHIWIDGVAYFEDNDTATYTMINSYGCDSIVTLNLTILEVPTVGILASEMEICLGDSLVLNGTGAAIYSWDFGVIDGDVFTPSTTGEHIYTVSGISDLGCSDTASITITVIDCDPIDPDFLMDSTACINDCITLTDLSSGGTITAWNWNFDGATEPNTATAQNPIICLNHVGIYNIELIITNPNGSNYTISKVLTVFENPTINTTLDTIINISGDANLTANTETKGDYLWTPSEYVECANCPITTASPIETTTYTVTFTDTNGCMNTDTVLVMINFTVRIGVPTAFSPNGDGTNDLLFVKGEQLKSINFIVYNRYGELVFETTDQSIGWDGIFNGLDENPGVFTWVLYYTLDNGETGAQQGDVTLLK